MFDHFRLNPISIGKGAVLKSFTRLLSGAVMEGRSVLLEHTLVLAGETVECGAVWQGWPSASQRSLAGHRSHSKALLDKSLRFGLRSEHSSEHSFERKKEGSSFGRVFINTSDSVRWNQRDADGRASGEKAPLLKDAEVRDFPHVTEIEMV